MDPAPFFAEVLGLLMEGKSLAEVDDIPFGKGYLIGHKWFASKTIHEMERLGLVSLASEQKHILEITAGGRKWFNTAQNSGLFRLPEKPEDNQGKAES